MLVIEHALNFGETRYMLVGISMAESVDLLPRSHASFKYVNKCSLLCSAIGPHHAVFVQRKSSHNR